MRKFYNIHLKKHGLYGCGFFSNYRVCLEQLIIHYDSKLDSIPYIDWSDTAFVDGFNPYVIPPVPENSKNPFDYWFEQEIPTDDDMVIQFPVGESMHRGDIIDHSKHYFDDAISLNKQQTIDKLYLKPKQHIVKKIDNIYDKHFKGNTVLGIMARGTEYNLYHPDYGTYTIDGYIKTINETLENNQDINKIFIVSEDQHYVDKIHKNFANSIYVEAYRKTTESDEYCSMALWPNFYNGRSDHRRKLGEETIIQTKLLGKCDYLLGIHSGIFAGAVLWGENLKKIFKL